jgi:hypothetical protein
MAFSEPREFLGVDSRLRQPAPDEIGRDQTLLVSASVTTKRFLSTSSRNTSSRRSPRLTTW